MSEERLIDVKVTPQGNAQLPDLPNTSVKTDTEIWQGLTHAQRQKVHNARMAYESTTFGGALDEGDRQAAMLDGSYTFDWKAHV